jgi:hypothetical protein
VGLTCANTLILPIISSPVPFKEDYAYLIVYSILELNADLMLTIFSPWHSDVGSNARMKRK